MHDTDTVTTFIGHQRMGEEEIEYGPEVPLATRLRLELANLHA